MADSDNPRTSQGLLPATMAGASRGMAGMVMPTQQSLSQEIYQRYYPAIYAVDYMQQAIAAAEANPYVDTANALAVEVQGMQKRYDARRAELVAQQKAILAQRAKLNAARIKGASGGGYKMLTLALDGIKAMEDIDVQMDTLRSGRLEMGGVEDRMAQVDTYGDIDSLSQGGRAAIESIARVVEGDTATSATSEQILQIAASETGAALEGIRASDDLLTRGSAARALAIRLENSNKVDAGKAAQFAADYFRLGDMTQLATASGQAKVKQQLRSTVDEAVVSSGIGEDDLPRQRALAGEVVRLALTGIGAGKGAAAAVSAQEKAKQLTPQESADLRLYLAALANDGIANLEEGETVLTGGREVALSPEQIAKGKQAYDKAKKHGTFRAEDAAWFDDELLKMYKDKVERGAEADAKRAMAIGRAERTPEEVRREAAEQFVRTATAARDLEDYVPLDTPGVNSAFEATVMGGASHIARREGKGVFDLKAAHEDRARRLGGPGPLAQTPLRKAQDAFRLAGGSETAPMSDEQFGKAAQALRQRFKRNPDRAEQALQYLFAMQLVSTQQRDGQSADPSTVETDVPPPAPPVSASRADRIAAGNSVVDDAAMRAPVAEQRAPTGAGASRAASSPVLTATPEEADLFLQQMAGEPAATDLQSMRLKTVGSAPVLDKTGMSGTRESIVSDPIGLPLLYQPEGVPFRAGVLPSSGQAMSPITTNNGNMQTGEVKTDEQLLQSRFASRPSRAEVMSMGAPSASLGATAGLFVDALGNIVDARTIAAQQAAAEQAARGTRR